MAGSIVQFRSKSHPFAEIEPLMPALFEPRVLQFPVTDKRPKDGIYRVSDEGFAEQVRLLGLPTSQLLEIRCRSFPDPAKEPEGVIHFDSYAYYAMEYYRKVFGDPVGQAVDLDYAMEPVDMPEWFPTMYPTKTHGTWFQLRFTDLQHTPLMVRRTSDFRHVDIYCACRQGAMPSIDEETSRVLCARCAQRYEHLRTDGGFCLDETDFRIQLYQKKDSVRKRGRR